MEEVITLALTIPDLSSYSAEDLFYGSFVALCEIKNLQLTSLQEKVLISHILNLDIVSGISKSMVQVYN